MMTAAAVVFAYYTLWVIVMVCARTCPFIQRFFTFVEDADRYTMT